MVIILILMALSATMVPVLVNLVRQQAKSTHQTLRTSIAFQLAEAAVKRGYWKLVEQSTNWNTIKTGGSITGYNNDTTYTDVSGGTYRIDMNGDSSLNQITLIGTGKSATGNEFRSIQIVYTTTSIQGAIQAPAVSFGGSAVVWWGPMLSTADIALAGSANEYYPRKRARGQITASGSIPDRDTSIAQPNSDGLEWWSYNEAPGVPDIPVPDLTFYRGEASLQGNYYTTNQSWNNYVNTSDTLVYFFEGNASFGGAKHFRGKMFVMGNLSFAGTNDSAGNYVATPPALAWQEYQKDCPNAVGPDTAATAEYPGDGGYHTVGTYNFNTSSGGASARAVTFKGFAYVAGSITITGNVRIHGAIIVSNGGSMGSGGCEIFYDDTLNVTFSNSTPSVVSWREIAPSTW